MNRRRIAAGRVTRASVMFGLGMVQIAMASPTPSLSPSQSRGESSDGSAADLAKLQVEVSRLKQELRDQKQLIFQLMQIEQQRYEVFLKYLQSGQPPGTGGIAGFPPPPTLQFAAGDAKDPGPPPQATGRESGNVSGHVRVTGLAGAEVYAYVDGPKAAPVRNHTVEIQQKDKQFIPRAMVVPLGTRVVFPNADTIIHNVFSQTQGSAFDLGSIKGGEKSTPVVLLKPGPVEIYCNIHSKMKAEILVVPNSHWTRVDPDGSFQLSGVPVGLRRVIVWGPGLKSASQQLEVTAKGGTVTLSTEAAPAKPHPNKRGEAYGSYDE
jgi:plastocyanin